MKRCFSSTVRAWHWFSFSIQYWWWLHDNSQLWIFPVQTMYTRREGKCVPCLHWPRTHELPTHWRQLARVLTQETLLFVFLLLINVLLHGYYTCWHSTLSNIFEQWMRVTYLVTLTARKVTQRALWSQRLQLPEVPQPSRGRRDTVLNQLLACATFVLLDPFYALEGTTFKVMTLVPLAPFSN